MRKKRTQDYITYPRLFKEKKAETTKILRSNPCLSDSKDPSFVTYVKSAWIVLGTREAINKCKLLLILNEFY